MEKRAPQPVVFKTYRDMPPMAVSVGSMLVNRTGSWRYVRPTYENKTAPCSYACPAGEDIATYMRLLQEGKPVEAWQTIRKENPFPAVCGRVCPHFCELDCNRDILGGTVAIHSLERYVGDLGLELAKRVKKTVKKNSPRVAIVGAGPAGLSCAYFLALKGYRPTVFEAYSEPGGVMRFGIPKYRLPKDVLESEISLILRLGVEIKTGITVGKDMPFSKLDDYDAVFFAPGFMEGRKLGVRGEDHPMVLPGLELLRKLNEGKSVRLGKRVAVVGGGNTAMDVSRSLLRKGIQVRVLYRRTREEMPAIYEEVEEALVEGVRIDYLTAPVEVRPRGAKGLRVKCIRMKLGKPDDSGRRRPVPIKGSEYSIDLDALVKAIGEQTDASCIPEEIQDEWGNIEIDCWNKTGSSKLYAGGDAATMEGTVVHAIASGKRAAVAIESRFKRKKLPMGPKKVLFNPGDVDPHVVRADELNMDYFDSAPRIEQRQIPLAQRLRTTREVNLSFSKDEAIAEAERCFSCGTCNMCDNCYIYCPDISIRRKPAGFGYIINYDYCKGCGVCNEECPRNAISMREEIG